MNKALMYKRDNLNESLIEKTGEQLNEVLSLLNEKELNVKKDITTLEKIARGGSDAVKEALAEKLEKKTILGFSQNRKKVVETLELPDLSEFERIKQNVTALNTNERYLSVKGSEVVFDKHKLQKDCEVYAETTNEKKFMEKLRKLEGTIKEIQALGVNIFESQRLSDIVKFDNEGKFMLNRNFIKQNHSNLKE